MAGQADGYAVIDLETTGVFNNDRIIEISVVMLDTNLEFEAEYDTLVDPRRDLGPTDIHRITPSMVSMAPEFGDIAGALSQRMQNRVLVAHNIQFESRMLFNEFNRVKAKFDPGVGICTLRHTKEKLPVACDLLGISKPTHHHALSDARATAEILRVLRPEEETRSMSVSNLDVPNDNRTHRRNADRAENVLGRLISRMTYKGITDSHLAYIDLLDWVLDDLVITDEEREQMLLLSNELNMTPAQLREAHEQYFTSMVRGAEKDGVITTDEHRCLGMVANALELPVEWVPKPDDDNDPTAQVTAGSSVCFTGSFVDLNGNPISKSALKELTVSSGLEVVANVTKSKCDFLVAVDPSSSSGKTKKARAYGIPVIGSEEFLRALIPKC